MNPLQVKNNLEKYEWIFEIREKEETAFQHNENIHLRTLQILQSSKLNHLEQEQREIIEKLTAQFQEVFAIDTEPLPCTDLTEHGITLKSGKIINLRSHRLPDKHRKFSLEETNKLFKKGIIKESQSPYNSPLWIVPKKGNKLRMVVDYREINEDTDQYAYPLPIIDDILDQLGNEKLFSSFNLSAVIHQIPMRERDKKYAAFSTSQGHFEYNRMPFVLKNAPATFPRMIDNAFRGLIGNKFFA